MKFFEEKIAETQKETLWKIRDVEAIIETRISEQKVDDIVSALDAKLTHDLKMQNDK